MSHAVLPGTMIKRLKYLSRQSYPMTRSDIDDIANVASVRNAKVGVTGAFMVTGNVFFQVIEGPAAAVDTLFAAIAADKRHRDVMCLGVQTGRSERIFPQWSMARVALESTPEAADAEAMLVRLASAADEERATLSDELARLMASQLLAA